MIKCVTAQPSKKSMITKVISFDFDGVFVQDSDAVFKRQAWKVALAPYEGRYELFLAEGNSLYGSGKPGGRVEILRHVYQRLGEPAHTLDARVGEAAKTFDDYVQKKIREAGVVPGARELLLTLSQHGLPLYLNSGTPTSALERSAHNLTIDHFFRGILGSTQSKVDNLLFIIKQERAVPAQILVVGDGDSDVTAAREVGCPFVGIANNWNRWGSEEPFPVVADLFDLATHIISE